MLNPFPTSRRPYPDDCCEDRALYQALFREIEEETGVRLFDPTGPEAAAELEPLALPNDKSGILVWDKTAIDLAVEALLRGCEAEGNVLGMDCEWEPAFDGSTEKAVCTLQLALRNGTSYLFHLQRGQRQTTGSTFNVNLKRLLSDPTITKVRLGDVVFKPSCIFLTVR